MMRQHLEYDVDLPEVTVNVQQKKGETKLLQRYSGYDVRNLKQDWSGTRHVEFVSADGMVTAVGVEEILVTGNVLLVQQECSNQLPNRSYRLVIAADTAGRRWCKDVIEVISVEE